MGEGELRRPLEVEAALGDSSALGLAVISGSTDGDGLTTTNASGLGDDAGITWSRAENLMKARNMAIKARISMREYLPVIYTPCCFLISARPSSIEANVIPSSRDVFSLLTAANCAKGRGLLLR